MSPGPSNDDVSLYSLLEALAHRLGIRVRVDDLAASDDGISSRGGICTVRGEMMILLERSLDTRERCHVLLDAFASLNLLDVFVPPLLRQLIEERRSA